MGLLIAKFNVWSAKRHLEHVLERTAVQFKINSEKKEDYEMRVDAAMSGYSTALRSLVIVYENRGKQKKADQYKNKISNVKGLSKTLDKNGFSHFYNNFSCFKKYH